MALKLNLTETNVGLPAPEAYAKIASLNYNARTGEVHVYVDIFASAEARTAEKNPIGGGVYKGTVGVNMPSLDSNIPGLRAAVYSWLKTLPAFTEAKDV